MSDDRPNRRSPSTLREPEDTNLPGGRPPRSGVSPVGTSSRRDTRRSIRARHQVVLQLLPGAEPWVRVEHALGSFKVPALVPMQEVLQLVADRVRTTPKATTSEATVRVPLSLWRALQR